MKTIKGSRHFGRAALLITMTAMLVSACSGENGGNGGNRNTSPAKIEGSDSNAPGEGGQTDSALVSDKPITFKWLVPDRREAPVRKDWAIFDRIFERTNARIEFEPVPSDGVTEKKQIMIATNSVTDFMTVPHADARLYGNEGVFLDLSSYIDEHAPHIKAYFEEYPAAKALVTGEDGGVYSVPGLEGLGFNYNWIVRQDLMEEYGLKSPDTPEQLYEMLKAFKERNPDKYPLVTQGVGGTTGLYKVMLRAFTGIEGYIQLEPESGEYKFAGDHPGFVDSLEYMNKLYNEKLLDPEFAILNGAQWEERMLTGKSFVTYHWKTRNQLLTDRAAEAGLIPGYNANAMLEIAASGIKKYQYSRDIFSTGGIAISANVKDKVAAVKLLDYLLSEEGSDYLALGIDGETYDRSEGAPKFLESLGPAPYDKLRGEYGIWYPEISLNMGKSREAERLSEKAQAIEELYLPIVLPAPAPLVLTDEENEINKEKLNNLTVYIEEKMTEFVVGRTPITAPNIQAFIEQCKKLGAQELIDMYNTARGRTNASNS
ncbi:hypothetical protein B1748_11965 [Paenibacillus sp. MY03]|uniref:extracellular solute-binding protein n=1 Tax=Paenibacillus sp. MY03 TaxID=302980 RepID=UPI000B3CF016|nr:extracellular solute-binding protein [Paenibacillus sp. MY03]OUS76395.1 hypothetical protein B1748_11965 [Paenibacillus sp. MY03]